MPIINRMPDAVRMAESMIVTAEKKATFVFLSQSKDARQVAYDRFTFDMAMARGALMALRTLLPNDPELEQLHVRCNHMPLICILGPEKQKAS